MMGWDGKEQVVGWCNVDADSSSARVNDKVEGSPSAQPRDGQSAAVSLGEGKGREGHKGRVQIRLGQGTQSRAELAEGAYCSAMAACIEHKSRQGHG